MKVKKSKSYDQSWLKKELPRCGGTGRIIMYRYLVCAVLCIVKDVPVLDYFFDSSCLMLTGDSSALSTYIVAVLATYCM